MRGMPPRPPRGALAAVTCPRPDAAIEQRVQQLDAVQSGKVGAGEVIWSGICPPRTIGPCAAATVVLLCCRCSRS